MNKKSKYIQSGSLPKGGLPGYPQHPASEDIYNQEEKVPLLEEDISDLKENENKLEGLGENLDVPGAELDDQEELIGEEDEENNYYSLGGDNHNDLEEDKGE